MGMLISHPPLFSSPFLFDLPLPSIDVTAKPFLVSKKTFFPYQAPISQPLSPPGKGLSFPPVLDSYLGSTPLQWSYPPSL